MSKFLSVKESVLINSSAKSSFRLEMSSKVFEEMHVGILAVGLRQIIKSTKEWSRGLWPSIRLQFDNHGSASLLCGDKDLVLGIEVAAVFYSCCACTESKPQEPMVV